MILTIDKKATIKEIDEIVKNFDGYIKIVVDIRKEVLCAGADRHVDEEQILIDNGSNQEFLWGGGLDINSGIIDYNSMINLRPNQGNPSRDIMSVEIRQKFDDIVNKLLNYEQ